MSPRRRAPRPISGAIGKVVAETAPQTLLAQVQTVWPRACGDAMAAQATPVAEKMGIVTVSCTSSVWASELEMLHDEIIGRLGKELSGDPPERLRFVVGEP